MNELEHRLLNDFQRDFPLVPAPFAAMAAQLGTTEETVLDRLRHLQEGGVVTRVGPVFRPHTVGASTLAAMAVPEERLEEVAAVVNKFPEVNHNYEREHRFNLWLVATAHSRYQLGMALADIERRARLPVMPLPMLDDYHIDLGFKLQSGVEFTRAGHLGERAMHRRIGRRRGPLHSGPQVRDLVEAIQHGLPLVPMPFAEIASMLGAGEEEVIARIAGMLGDGTIKRLGVVVRHRALGYRANAMVVWDIPDGRVSHVGRQLAGSGPVTLCYRRQRHLPEWPYNLYCMIHGRDRETVGQQLDSIVHDAGLDGYGREVLFSGRCFKQRGAIYRQPAVPGAVAA